MEFFWWMVALAVMVALGAWIATAFSASWVAGALIALIVWIVAGLIRLGSADDVPFIFFIGD